MPAARRTLAVLLLACTLPAAARAAVPVLHASAGTGACAPPRAAGAPAVENPCWLLLGLAPAVRLGRVEAGLVYQGRDLVRLVGLGLLRPPSVTALGASAGVVLEPGERWRLQGAAEGGWQRYADFSGRGVHRQGAIDTAWLGGTGRAAFGLRPQAGRADRLEVSLSLRRDLARGRATVAGLPWRAGGWLAGFAFGLVSEW